jgi:serine/threonine protein kinase/formylglycine-generating enzyme required for sulfatase activity
MPAAPPPDASASSDVQHAPAAEPLHPQEDSGAPETLEHTDPSAYPSQPYEMAAGPESTLEGIPPPQRPRTASRDSGPSADRDVDIPIADLKLLRRIGSGAYGEVWLAQAITGALRAVKIVWREDFEYEKTFHREFEGIQQFEPISRGHRGLVNVLHVGWNEVRGFYYYVMELGDDAEHGNQFDILTYVPRTLSTDFKRHGRLNLDFCQETGNFLADALGYMHSYGLTHRDIKPSNIIFVDSVCKLADIGLVAAHGEHSFVGTEGFVPPEGPGTFAADIYSLGKVLYEISSGNDRMDFPAIPDDLGPEEWKLWREWNAVICKACAPSLKDRFASAADFAEALRGVGVPKKLPLGRRFWRGTWKLALGSVIAGAVLATVKREHSWSYTRQAPEARKLTQQEIAQAKLPNPTRIWLNSLDMRFSWNPKTDRHVADKPVSLDVFNRFVEDAMWSFEGAVERIPSKAGGKPEYAVVVPREDADAFTAWLSERDRQLEALSADFEYGWKPDTLIKPSPGTHSNWAAIRLEVVKLRFGRVTIRSTPSNAEVLRNGDSQGTTPLDLPRTKVGDVEYVLTLPGYKRELLTGKLAEGKTLTFNIKMKATNAVAFGRKWSNSLSMAFVPLGDVLIAVKETTRADYASYLRSQPALSAPPVDVTNVLSLPMTHVSRHDAELFCQWLTSVEQAKGLLESGESYRLPTDDEWSMAAGLQREKGETPADKNQRVEGIYPWGPVSWPPSPVTANLWDKSAAEKAKRKDGIANFDDAFPELAPVGSFAANQNDVQDLAGNVSEWVHDDYGGAGQEKLGVVRGGNWRTFNRQELLSSFRRPLPPDTRADDVGFRLVVSGDGIVARLEE